MLISFQKIVELCKQMGISLNGILHLGAHECEELGSYKENGMKEDCIAWIEAQPEKVEKMKEKGVKNIYNHCILDVETTLPFYVTSNGESSSVLEFGTHAVNHPHVKVTSERLVETITLKRFLDEHLEFAKFNFWNFDIQGVELRALKSAGDYINNVDAIYTEVNTDEVYTGCDQLSEMDEFLSKKGFTRIAQSIYTQYSWGDALYVRDKNI
jgi:FkbM family methyltransferase